MDRRLHCLGPLQGIKALGGEETRHLAMRGTHAEHRLTGGVVGAAHRLQTVEMPDIAAEAHLLARMEDEDAGLGERHAGDAEHGKAKARMGDRRRIHPPPQGPQPRPGLGQRHPEEAAPRHELGEGAEQHVSAEGEAERGHAGPSQHGDPADDRRRRGRPPEPADGRPQRRPLPREQGPHRHEEKEGDGERKDGEVEEGGPHAQLEVKEKFGEQRIDGAEEDHRGDGAEEDVVEHERRLARDGGEEPHRGEARSAPEEEQRGGADDEPEQGEDEHAARRVIGEGMHRVEDAGADEERPAEAQRKRPDGEQDGPHLERLALLDHDRRMDERGPGEPGEQRGILHRVPEPIAAPAEHVIGPPRAERDATGEKGPGGERPGSHPAPPGGIDPSLDEGSHREGEGNGEADIARIEDGRMEGEARILEQRVHAAPFHGRGPETLERIAHREREEEEADRGRPQHRDHPGPQQGGKASAEEPDRRAANGEDEAPEQDRALVIAPHAGDLVEERLGALTVLGDVEDREIGDDAAPLERTEGEQQGEELPLGERRRRGEQALIAPRRADQREHRLGQRQGGGKGEGEMAEFGDHPPPLRSSPSVFQLAAGGGGPASGCQCPLLRSASTTSFGM